MQFFSDFLMRTDAFHKFLETKPSMMHKIVDFCISMMHPDIQGRTRVHYGMYVQPNSAMVGVV